MLFLNIIIYVVKYFLILLTVILFSCSSQEESYANMPDNDSNVKPKLEKSEIVKNDSQDNKDENESEEPEKQTIIDDSFTPLLSIEFQSNSDNYIKANYRVTEQLARLSYPNDAVGYTEDITGGIYLDEKGIPAPESIINIDLSNLQSDESKRDNYLKRNSLETDKFPEVFFHVKEIMNLNTSSLLNLDKNEVEFQMIGDLTIHGVTQTKTWDIQAISEMGRLKGQGSISFPFSDFGMEIPKLFFIISVEDKITLELDFDLLISLNSSLNLDSISLPEFVQKEIANNNVNGLYTNAWLCTENDRIIVDDLSTDDAETWKCYVDIELTDDSVIVTSTGIPNHDFQSGLGCCAQENNYQWIIPTNPQFTEEIAMAPDRGPIAITVTGVPIYGPEEGPGGDAVALHFDYFEEDRQPIELGLCGGHSAGAYFHYHFDANCLHWHPEGTSLDWEDWDYTKNLNSDEHSPVIGFAFDGFPIYGPYGWDSYKNVIEITSSYRLKKDANGYNGIDDWEYIEGLGDTDECNGLSSSTPEVPDGIYHYVSTIRNGQGQIGFPYFLLCYHGVPNESNYDVGGQGQGPPGAGGQGQGPPDFTEAASKLGITTTELIAALGGPPPDFESAARILGVSIEELQKIIPVPPTVPAPVPPVQNYEYR